MSCMELSQNDNLKNVQQSIKEKGRLETLKDQIQAN